MSHIIVAFVGKKRLHFNGRKFTASGRPRVFASAYRAGRKHSELMQRYPVLHKHAVGIVDYKPTRVNPQPIFKPYRSEVLAARKRVLAKRKARGATRAQLEKLKAHWREIDRA